MSQNPTTQPIIEHILDSYGVELRRVLSPVTGYRNQSYAVLRADKPPLNLMLHKPDGGAALIRRANDVCVPLAAGGLPVRLLADDRIAKATAGTWQKYVALYNYLPGHTIPWESFGQSELKLAGWAMSDMHAIWAQIIPPKNLPVEAATNQQRLSNMKGYFADSSVRDAAQRKLGLSGLAELSDTYAGVLQNSVNLPGQTLHMDFVRGNLLYDEAANQPYQLKHVSLSGIIDFEKTAFGHPVFDLARSLAFFLVDCTHKSPRQVYKYFLLSGYQKRGRMATAALLNGFTNKRQFYDTLEQLIEFFLLYDLYKFMRHNPYESLAVNHHYQRTIAELSRRGKIMSKEKGK